MKKKCNFNEAFTKHEQNSAYWHGIKQVSKEKLICTSQDAVQYLIDCFMCEYYIFLCVFVPTLDKMPFVGFFY